VSCAVQDLESRLTDYLATPARQAAVVEETGHRPWPLPQGEWIQAQTWDHLLFAHWRVPEEELRRHVPEQLPLDTFDGSAWIAITPFRVSGLRVRGLLPLPYLSSFLELNTRTYVSLDGKPGIYFFSLDAESALAVEAARRLYRLPYFRARMFADLGPEIRYRSQRTEGERASFEGRYHAAGAAETAAAGSLEHFLTERYCLFTLHEGRTHWAEIHHPPWPLQPAEAEIAENTMPPPGIDLDGEPLLHYSERQDVVIWPLEAYGS
jgi:uncharacterized protein YqjF (DUF2071 family)